MNILFLSIGALSNLEQNVMYPDLLKYFRDHGHQVTAVCQREKRQQLPTQLKEEAGINVLRVRTGNITKTNPIEKGISTLLIGHQYKRAIKKYLSSSRYDLILYTTPPITVAGTVAFLKKRYHAMTYLMLKDIFPQNALDLGMLRYTGWKGMITRWFVYQEKKLYLISDCIGCMSSANAVYLLEHHPYLVNHRIEICPNTINPGSLSTIKKNTLREQFGLPQDKIIFICGGNFGKPQNVDFINRILELNEMYSDRYFVMCGSGTDFYKLKDNCKNNNSVRILEYLEQEEFGQLLEACDVGLLFLDYRFTIPNFPSRLLDYMNHGLPIFAATDRCTDVGLTIDSGDFGWWSKSSDVWEYQQVVNEICTNPEEITRKGSNSRSYLEEHYATRFAYEKILSSYAFEHRR